MMERRHGHHGRGDDYEEQRGDHQVQQEVLCRTELGAPHGEHQDRHRVAGDGTDACGGGQQRQELAVWVVGFL